MIVAAWGYFLHFFVNCPCSIVETPSMLHPHKNLESDSVCPSLKWFLSYVDLFYKWIFKKEDVRGAGARNWTIDERFWIIQHQRKLVHYLLFVSSKVIKPKQNLLPGF